MAPFFVTPEKSLFKFMSVFLIWSLLFGFYSPVSSEEYHDNNKSEVQIKKVFIH